MKFKRIFLLVLDSIGVGESLDAHEYGDSGSNTLKHIVESTNVFIPNLENLGFLNTINLDNKKDVSAYYTIMRPKNKGKDTASSHYEIMGIPDNDNIILNNDGLPQEIINTLEKMLHKQILGNKLATFDKIFEEYPITQLDYSNIILYMPNNREIGIIANESDISINNIYKICEIIKATCLNYHISITKVTAYPIIKKGDSFFKTKNSKDFYFAPTDECILNYLVKNKYDVIAIGKSNDIFNGSGITKRINVKNNRDSLDKLIDIMGKNFQGLCVCDISDFDNNFPIKDLNSFTTFIEDFDVEIPVILNNIGNDDLLLITSDHGNDPTINNGGSSRENVFLLAYSRIFKNCSRLEIRNSLADIAATISDNFHIEIPKIGSSFLNELK